MLADTYGTNALLGLLRPEVHLPIESLHELLDFIGIELPKWRDRRDRKRETSETALTSQLSRHLNSAARHSAWDFLQFATEVPDERRAVRKIDIAVSGADSIVWVQGRRYSDLDTLLPIECKRLPTPKGKKRDEREYVINRNSSTGGIHRFKAGYHGSGHDLGAMIAYIQKDEATIWHRRVDGWVHELMRLGVAGWTEQDSIHVATKKNLHGMSSYRSTHVRGNNLNPIELRHLWIEM